MMRRRHFVIALGALSLGVRLPAKAQSRRVRIAYLSTDPNRGNPLFQAFVDAMRERGWVEGASVEYLFHASGGRDELFAGMAQEAVAAGVDLIVTVSSASTKAAKEATGTIPIVFASVANPLEQGFVASLERPDGNVTGLSLLVRELGPRRLRILKQMLPAAKRFARLYQASSIAAMQQELMREDDAAARELGVTLEHVPIENLEQLEAGLAALALRGIEAAHVTAAAVFNVNRVRLAELALKHRLPLICTDARFVEAGALCSYGENQVARFRALAAPVDKVLRGASPAELPVEQPTVFELTLNASTAQAIQVRIPDAVLAQATRIIR